MLTTQENPQAAQPAAQPTTQPAKPPSPPGCSSVAAETVAIFCTVLLWVPITYWLLPLLHETTPLAYGVTTALVLLWSNGVRRVLIEGAANNNSNRTQDTNTSKTHQ